MIATEPSPIPTPTPVASADAHPVPGADPAPDTPVQPRAAQPRNPLHGVTLEAMVVGLADYFGWEELGRQIPVRCFQSDPSVPSSLKFLRKTPWARDKVEGLYLFMLREIRRTKP